MDDALHFWNCFKQHHNFGESKIEQAKALALAGGKEGDWSTLAARIARDSPEKYGALHPLGPISRQSLKIVIQDVASDCREINLGRR